MGIDQPSHKVRISPHTWGPPSLSGQPRAECGVGPKLLVT